MINFNKIDEYLNNANCRTKAIAEKLLRENIIKNNDYITKEELLKLSNLLYKYKDKKYVDIYYDKLYEKNARIKIIETCSICNKKVEFSFYPKHYEIENFAYKNDDRTYKKIIGGYFSPYCFINKVDDEDNFCVHFSVPSKNSKSNFIFHCDTICCGECAREQALKEIEDFRKDFIDNKAYNDLFITYDEKERKKLNKKFTELAKKSFEDEKITYDCSDFMWLLSNYDESKEHYDLYKAINKYLKRYYEKDKDYYTLKLNKMFDKAMENSDFEENEHYIFF